MSFNQKKNDIPQNNFRNPESNMRNLFNNIFEQNQRPNNIQSIKMSFNQNQNNFNNNNFNNNNNNFDNNNFQNFQMPMNFMNNMNNMNFNNLNNNNIILIIKMY